MSEIEGQFRRDFESWSIALPPEDVKERRRGKILAAGWAIWYLFGTDERGEYLDYYASHSMTEDRHVRLREDDTGEELPAVVGMRMVSRDPEEDARLEAEYFEENRRVAKMLEEKGFGVAGEEPALISVNRYLRTGGDR